MVKIESFTKPETERRGIKVDGNWLGCAENVWQGYNLKAPLTATAIKQDEEGKVTFIEGITSTWSGYSPSNKPAYKPTSVRQDNDLARQKMIIRQSSLTRSIEILNLMRENNGNTDEKIELDNMKTAVIHLASQLSDWVMDTEKPMATSTAYPEPDQPVQTEQTY